MSMNSTRLPAEVNRSVTPPVGRPPDQTNPSIDPSFIASISRAAAGTQSSRWTRVAGPTSQPPVTAASAPTATIDTAVVHTIDQTSPCMSRCDPLSVMTNAIGARNAGSVYFQVCHMVPIVLPPVIAAAATAARAVGGVTSDNTA